jgi:arylsulfatase A-like enzyme
VTNRFFYLAYSIPHTPLEAPREYLDRLPGDMPERRRYALAMMAAMDDGVGEIVKLLKERGQYENTRFCYASDNNAPLKMTMDDKPLTDRGGWPSRWCTRKLATGISRRSGRRGRDHGWVCLTKPLPGYL